jgi:hypothetical protein
MPCEFSNIVVSPQKLKFTVQAESQFIQPYQFISLKKGEEGVLAPTWDAFADAGWIYFRPGSGSISEDIQVTCSSIGMAAGIYRGQITITSHVQVLPSPIIDIEVEIKGPEPVPEPVPAPVPEPVPAPAPAPDPQPGVPPAPIPEGEPIPESPQPFEIWELIKKIIDWILEKIFKKGG